MRGGQRGRIEQRTRRGERIRGRVPKFFEPDPTVILVACSTGSLGGIGQEISSIGATVIAPEIPTNLKGVNVTRSSETGKLEFAVEYRDSGTERTYIAGQ